MLPVTNMIPEPTTFSEAFSACKYSQTNTLAKVVRKERPVKEISVDIIALVERSIERVYRRVSGNGKSIIIIIKSSKSSYICLQKKYICIHRHFHKLFELLLLLLLLFYKKSPFRFNIHLHIYLQLFSSFPIVLGLYCKPKARQANSKLLMRERGSQF